MSMRRTTAVTWLAILVAAAAPPAVRGAQVQDPGQDLSRPLLGTWAGGIHTGGRSVRTVLRFALDASGGLGGTMDSPDQSAFGLAVSDVELDGEALSFRVPDTQGSWRGRFETSADRLVGVWSQRGAELELVFDREEPEPLAGTWEGVGAFGALRLRIRFHVGTKSDGTLGADLVSPDQSQTHVPVSAVEVREDGTVVFDVASLGARFEGVPDEGRTCIEGRFFQSGSAFPLVLERMGAVPVLRRPQTPEPPFPYRAEDVSYDNPAAGNRLAGTLTLPSEGGPFAAVLLITGSGQQDRNEEIFGHKPFLVLADWLTRAGIAVLRVDDRGVGGSTGEVLRATSADFATDVSAGIDWLKTREDVRADRIGLIGHSEGGLIAPMVAAERDDVAFLVLLAGPGLRGDEVLLRQAALLARAGGAPEAGIAANRAMQEKLFAILHEESDPAEARARLREVLVSTLGEKGAQAELQQVASPWFRFFVNHDPAPVLREVRCPVLALNGAKDLQVPAEEDLAAIGAALEEGGNPDHTEKAYPGLNHLFQPCTTGAVKEYAEIETTMSEDVLRDLTAWVLERCRTD